MFYLIIIIGIILDLYSKNLAFRYFQEKINILGDFLFFKYSENTGVAFSTQVPFLKLGTIILITIALYIYFLDKKEIQKNTKNNKKQKLKLLDLSFGLILAGGIANGYERIFNSKVIDFIGIEYFSIFNLADSFITIGIFIYLINSLGVFDHKKET